MSRQKRALGWVLGIVFAFGVCSAHASSERWFDVGKAPLEHAEELHFERTQCHDKGTLPEDIEITETTFGFESADMLWECEVCEGADAECDTLCRVTITVHSNPKDIDLATMIILTEMVPDIEESLKELDDEPGGVIVVPNVCGHNDDDDIDRSEASIPMPPSPPVAAIDHYPGRG